MVPPQSAQVQRERVDVHQERLRGGQGANGSSRGDASTTGIHKTPGVRTIKGKAVEIDRVRSLDHVSCGQKLGEQGWGRARDGERGLPMRVYGGRVVKVEETGLALRDRGLDGRDGGSAERHLVDGVEDDVSVHSVRSAAGSSPEGPGKLSAVEGDVGGGDVPGVEEVIRAAMGRVGARHNSD